MVNFYLKKTLWKSSKHLTDLTEKYNAKGFTRSEVNVIQVLLYAH